MTGRAGWRTIAGGVLAFVLVAPLVPLVVWSFARGWRWPALLPQGWTLAAWEHALSQASGMPGALATSLAVSACVTLLAVLAGVPAGMVLGRGAFRGRGVVQALVLAPILVPGIAVALGLQGVFLWAGLANTALGVVLVHLVPVLPYMVLVVAGVAAGREGQMAAQARTLGATPLQALRHVTLPGIAPGIAVGALFAFLVSWGQYALTLTIGGGKVVTLPILLYNFASSGRHDLAGAIAVVYMAPGIVVVALTARRLTGAGVAS